MTLASLQKEFCARILDDIEPDEKLFGPEAAVRIGIYRNAYRARLIECLQSSFEKTWCWIGDDAFGTAARHHAILNPPQSWTLDDYGTGFHATLATLFPNDSEVAELAWLEWAMQNAFGSADEKPVDAAMAQDYLQKNGDLDAVQITLVRSFRMSVIRTNSTALWQAIADGTTPPSPIALEGDNYLRVWRKGFSPHFKIIDQVEAAALTSMARGEKFGTLCSDLARNDGADSAIIKAGTLLGNWLGDGLIARLS